MNSVVCLKYTPTENGRYELGLADEAALEWALRISEEGSVTVIAMGPFAITEEMKRLKDYGIKRIILLCDNTFAGADTFATSFVLEKVIRKIGNVDIILCGRRGVGGETGQVPAQLAGLLDYLCITNVIHMEKTQECIKCKRLLEKGIQIIEAKKPVVVSCCEYHAKLRFPKLSDMRKNGNIEVEIVTHELLGIHEAQCGNKGSKTKVIQTYAADVSREVHMLEGKEDTLKVIIELLMEGKSESGNFGSM